MIHEQAKGIAMSERHNFTRRALLASAAATVSSAALAVAIVPSVPAGETCSIDLDELSTDGLSGLPLAAVHIERAVQAMGNVTFGRWQVSIVSGDRDQPWSFKQINPNRVDPVVAAIADYRAGQLAYDAHGIINRVEYSIEEWDQAIAETYGPAYRALLEWDRPVVSTAGVDAALGLALEASSNGDNDLAQSMISAARGYITRA